MNPINLKLQKTSRIILIIIRLVQIGLLCSVGFNIYTGIVNVNAGVHQEMGNSLVLAITYSSVSVVIFIALFIVASFLKSIKLEYTPFTDKNVSRLKILAILIMLIEPIQMAINYIGNSLRPLTIDGFKVEIHGSMGGIVILLGLVVFCIALVFEYGSCLQKQFDETL